eukprot:5542162-Pleurochrysis_carterae.AAC.1
MPCSVFVSSASMSLAFDKAARGSESNSRWHSRSSPSRKSSCFAHTRGREIETSCPSPGGEKLPKCCRSGWRACGAHSSSAACMKASFSDALAFGGALRNVGYIGIKRVDD